MNVHYSKIIILHICVEFATSCEKGHGHCCVDHYKDEDGICTECPFGTFGINCTSPCPTGYFGKICQSVCKCTASECDAKNGCSLPEKSSSPTSLFPATNNASSRDSTISFSTKSTESIWKSTTILLIGALAVVLIYSGRKKCSSLVSKRRWGNATMSSGPFPCSVFTRFLFRVQNTGCRIDESLVNNLGESNHGSSGRNLTPLQKRRSSPTSYLKPREEDTSVSEQTYDDVWGEDGSLLTKQFNSSLSKTEGEQANKLSGGLTMLSEDKYRPYSSIKYNRYSHRNIKRNMPTVERESRESLGKPNNEYDDAISRFKEPTNRTNSLDVESISSYAQIEDKAHCQKKTSEERASSMYQEIYFGPTYNSESPDPSYTNQVQVPEYETERCSSNHTGSKEDTESASNNSLYTSLIVGESSEYVFSSNEKENYNQYEL
ncbi:uncharacterized protein LOC111133108 isoform X2 [Crassostrea virginica]